MTSREQPSNSDPEQGAVKVGGTFGRMSLHGDAVVLFTSNDGLNIDPDVVRRTDAEMHSLAGGPYVSVLDFRPASWANREARDLAALATSDSAAATAVIFGGDVGKWLLDSWVEDSAPQRPVAFFTDVPPALEWATRQATDLLNMS